VLPRRDRQYSSVRRALGRRFPVVLRAARGGQYWWHELLARSFLNGGPVRSGATAQARLHLAAQVRDPALRAMLTPDYEIGCKRVLLSDDFYPAVASETVQLVPHAVQEVRPHGVVGADGVEHPVDVLVFGTGFSVLQIPLAQRLVGREGRSLAEQWSTGAVAHRGTTVAGFPNLFLLLGPNTVVGHTSAILMIEAQIAYVVAALRTLEAYDARALEVRRAAQVRYDADVQARLSTTVWNAGGCRSWYRAPDGRNFTVWPGHAFTFQRQMARFDAESYSLRGRAVMQDGSPAALPKPA
jgi:cation diffusion facilitator CzcD-associated flavoprotein CzcO